MLHFFAALDEGGFIWPNGSGLLNYMQDNDGNRTDYLYDRVGRLTGIWAATYGYVSFAELHSEWQNDAALSFTSTGDGMQRNAIVMLSAIIMALVSSWSWAASVYKCKNQQGNLIYQESPCKQDVQALSSWGASEMQQLDGVLILKQRGNGHYFLEAMVNDKALTLLVDTGATGIMLPMSFALSAKITCRNKIFIDTANGVAEACTTIIPKLMFGPFTLIDIPAVISQNLGQPLLGMNVLQKFKIEQRNGELRISTQ